MKNHTLIISILILLSSSSFQSCKQPARNSVKYAFRLVEGGYDTVFIDTKTPLNELIKSLNKPWQFFNTGKADLIGYTDNMYSIANYQDEAIKPLLDLINTTDTLKTKRAALYTLHLIGTKGHIARRGHEEFMDTLVRNAMLSLISDKQLQKTVIYLLKRDPWSYDIPYLINYLSKSDSDDVLVLKSFRRYFETMDEKPLWQNLPKEILNKEITIKPNNPNSSHPIADMIALKNTLKERVVIDKEILESKEWTTGFTSFNSDTGHVWIRWYISENNDAYQKPHIDIIESFKNNESIDFVGLDDDDRFIYTYNNDNLYIYGPKKAREILIKWWTSMPDNERQKIQQLTRSIK